MTRKRSKNKKKLEQDKEREKDTYIPPYSKTTRPNDVSSTSTVSSTSAHVLPVTDINSQNTGNVETPESTMLTLEILFTSPEIWKSEKMTGFVSEFHDHIKERKDLSSFKEAMDSDAKRCEIWPANKTWESVIDDMQGPNAKRKHSDILKEFINKDGSVRKDPISVDPTKVTDLCGVIRNKYSHGNLLNEEKLEIMDWGQLNLRTGKLEFCGKKYAAYWTKRFPNLLPFSWNQGKRFINDRDFAGAYPESLRSEYLKHNLFDDTKTFGGQVLAGLTLNLEQGWMEDRYTLKTNSATTVEFRTLDIFPPGVGRSCFVEIEISENENNEMREQHVITKCFEVISNQVNLTDERTTILTYDKSDTRKVIYSGKIILCNKLADLEGHATKENRDVIIRNFSKLVIFTNRDLKQTLTTKDFVNKLGEVLEQEIVRSPIKWSDLSPTARETLMKEADIHIQGICLKLENLVEKLRNSEKEDEIFSNLQGTKLNELLRNKCLMISTPEKCIRAPLKDQIYMPRTVFSRGNVGFEFFLNFILKYPQSRNVFVIVQSGKRDVPENKNVKFTKIRSLEILREFDIASSNAQLFWVEEKITNFTPFSHKFEGLELKGVNAHFFKYSEHDRYDWIGTHGSFSEISDSLFKIAEKGASSQEIILQNILSSESLGKIIFISDQPGMGKTELLMKFAEKMKIKENTGVLWFEMKEIVENIGEIVTKELVLNTIVNLSNSDSLEKVILKHFLQSFPNFEKNFEFHFHIMIDGLDEVQTNQKALAFDVLKILHEEFPSIRVWVTGRDHMLEEVREKLGVLGYKFLPFSENEQVDYLQKIWRNCNSENESNCPDDKTLETFAKTCLKKCILNDDKALAGIPLQCKMIGEIFEEKVLARDFSLGSTLQLRLNDLYEKMLEKKFKVYKEEKEKAARNVGKNVGKIAYKSIRDCLVYLSIQLIFSKEKARKFKNFLQIPRKKHELEEMKADILKHGVVQSLSPIRFIHRTFAEYIVAAFATEEIKYCLGEEEMLDTLDEAVKTFIWNDVLATKGEFNLWEWEHQNVTSFLNMTLDPVFSKVPNIFGEMGNDTNFLQLAAMIYNIKKSESRWFYFEKGLVVTRQLSQFLMAIYNRLENVLKLLILEPEYPLHAFVFALNTQEFQIVKYIIEELNFGPERWHKVQEYDESRSGVLHRVLKNSLVLKENSFYASIWECSLFMGYAVRELPSLLEETDWKGRTPFLLGVNYLLQLAYISNEDLSESKNWGDFIRRRKESNANITEGEQIPASDRFITNGLFGSDEEKQLALKRQNLCHIKTRMFGSSETILYWRLINELIYLGANVNVTDENGNSGIFLKLSLSPSFAQIFVGDRLHFQLRIEFVDCFLRQMCDLMDINQFNRDGCTPLLTFLDSCSLHFKAKGAKEPVSEDKLYFEMIFNVFREYGTDFNVIWDKDGEPILDKAIRKGYRMLFYELMIHHGANILAKNRKGQSAIHVAVKNENIQLADYLIGKNIECMYDKDNQGRTAVKIRVDSRNQEWISYKSSADL